MAWVWLKLGGEQTTVYWALIATTVVAFVVRLFVVKRQLHFSLRQYIRESLLPIVPVTVVSFAAVWGVRTVMTEAPVWQFVGTVGLSVAVLLAAVWLFGVTRQERDMARRLAASLLHKKS
jgi:hypothetical protein